jgi:hypothetical protein
MLFNEATLATIGLYKNAIEACRLARRYDLAEALIVELQALLGN